jgi:hypothetical protein
MPEVVSESERIEAAARETPNKYIYTADLYETTDTNVASAQKASADLKNRKS